MTISSREANLADTLKAMEGSEPAEVQQGNPFDVDALDQTDGPMALWRITYQTVATPNTPAEDFPL